MSSRLSEKDHRVIAALRFSGRSSLLELSKVTGLTPHNVRTCLRHITERDILTPYVVVDVAALGLSDYGIFISAEAVGAASRRKLLDFLMASAHVPWITEYASGEYRYAFSVLSKDISEVDQLLTAIGTMTGQHRIRQSLVCRVRWHVYGEKYLSKVIGSNSGYSHGAPANQISLDTLDLKILRVLSAPRSESLTHMAKVLAIPKSTLEYRIKSLEKSKVIISYSMLPDVSKLGMQAYHFLVSERCRRTDFRDRFLKFLRLHPAVVAISINVGAWDYEFEVHVPSAEQLAFFESDLHSAFPLESLSVQVLQVLKVHKLQPLPSDSLRN